MADPDDNNMGGAESKEQETQVLNIFTPDERTTIHQLYTDIVGSQKSLTEPFLKKFLPEWFDVRLQKLLYKVLCKCNNNKAAETRHVSEMLFGGFLAEILKGTYNDKTDIVCLFSSVSHDHVREFDLYQTVNAIVSSYVRVTVQDKIRRTWQAGCTEADIARLSLSLLGMKEPPAESDQTSRSSDDVDLWISKCPLFVKYFDHVFHQLFPVVTKTSHANLTKSLMPVAQNVDWSKTSTILDYLSIGYLNFHLPAAHQSPWRLLYSNYLHGDSYAQLVRFVSGKGANVLVVRDKDGHTFGAYISESLVMRPQFYGSSDCFLFTLQPHYGMYTSTGYNDNFIYFNQGQETLPNGLGLGGQLDYFGLWIDYSFNSGHSKAKPKCTTYGSPQLSGSPDFVVDAIEVWAVGQEKKSPDSEEDEYNKTSILDKDIGAKAILEMAGKKQHSEGLRELTEEEGPMSDEMKRKMNTIPSMF